MLSLYLFAGVIYSLVLPSEARFSDEREYLQLSDNLRHGPGYSLDGIHLTASRPPGYAFFISAIESMGGNIPAIRVVQYALLGATILLDLSTLPQKRSRRRIADCHGTGDPLSRPFLYECNSLPANFGGISFYSGPDTSVNCFAKVPLGFGHRSDLWSSYFGSTHLCPYSGRRTGHCLGIKNDQVAQRIVHSCAGPPF